MIRFLIFFLATLKVETKEGFTAKGSRFFQNSPLKKQFDEREKKPRTLRQKNLEWCHRTEANTHDSSSRRNTIV